MRTKAWEQQFCLCEEQRIDRKVFNEWRTSTLARTLHTDVFIDVDSVDGLCMPFNASVVDDKSLFWRNYSAGLDWRGLVCASGNTSQICSWNLVDLFLEAITNGMRPVICLIYKVE